jgi:hypothetical protein
MEISIEGCGSGMLACLHKAMMNQDTVELKFKAKVFGLDIRDAARDYYDVWADVAKIGSVVLVTDDERHDTWDAATVEAQDWLKLHAREYVMIHAISGETCFFMDTFIKDFLKHVNEVRYVKQSKN